MKTPSISTKLNPLEWHFWQTLEALKVTSCPVLVAVSGGLDSVVLAYLVARLRDRLKLNVTLAHVHHGFSSQIALQHFRLHAQSSVRDLAAQLECAFVTNDPSQDDHERVSEAELREFRYDWFESWRHQMQVPFILLAHHQQDQLETRVLRLIRGTHLEGISGMSLQNGALVRPLLERPRRDLETYAAQVGVKWVEDPSNLSCDPLRNWVRKEWLPQLETRVPGAMVSLGASLEGLARAAKDLEEAETSLENATLPQGGLDLSYLSTLPEVAQCRVLARYLRSLGVYEYTRGQLREIVKRLDSAKSDLTFVVGGLVWFVNAQQLSASKTPKR